MILKTWLKQRKFYIMAFAGIAVSFGAVTTYAIVGKDTVTRNFDQSSTQGNIAAQNGLNNQDVYENIVVQPEAVLDSTAEDTKAQLLYLIEEEKLAHDVYQRMYELYDARIFGNITKSEAGHQSRVLALLAARDISDPRSDQVGTFTDQSLQKLYDELITQGSQSLNEAYKVGIAIEELDIADIKQDLASLDPVQTDIKAALESLLRGSENHLRAFNRQVR